LKLKPQRYQQALISSLSSTLPSDEQPYLAHALFDDRVSFQQLTDVGSS
jgi:hypothetical protein